MQSGPTWYRLRLLVMSVVTRVRGGGADQHLSRHQFTGRELGAEYRDMLARLQMALGNGLISMFILGLVGKYDRDRASCGRDLHLFAGDGYDLAGGRLAFVKARVMGGRQCPYCQRDDDGRKRPKYFSTHVNYSLTPFRSRRKSGTIVSILSQYTSGAERPTAIGRELSS